MELFRRVRIFLSENKKDLLLAVIAFLVILTSFGLGYFAARDFSMTPIIIQKSSCN